MACSNPYDERDLFPSESDSSDNDEELEEGHDEWIYEMPAGKGSSHSLRKSAHTTEGPSLKLRPRLRKSSADIPVIPSNELFESVVAGQKEQVEKLIIESSSSKE